MNNLGLRDQIQNQKNPRAHKNKIGTPPLPIPKYHPPPLNEQFYGHGFFLQKERIFPGVRKIGAPISGPKIADMNFAATRIFLKKGRSIRRKSFVHKVYSVRRGTETMVSVPMVSVHGPDHGVGVDPSLRTIGPLLPTQWARNPPNWAAANGGVTNGGLRGVWPPFLEIGRNRPKSPFFCLFRPFPEGAKSTWEIQRISEEKGLFPQISSDFPKNLFGLFLTSKGYSISSGYLK